MAARRDVKALTSTITELAAGDRVRIGVNHPRYGECTVEATVVETDTAFTAGGWGISKAGKPTRHLTELVVLSSAGNHAFGIGEDTAGLEGLAA